MNSRIEKKDFTRKQPYVQPTLEKREQLATVVEGDVLIVTTGLRKM
jgi:hypothetical protein